MKNARQELIDKLNEIDKTRITDIVAFNIVIYNWDDTPRAICKGTELTADLLNNLDILYDEGYGHQELIGTVLFSDNTWLSRNVYDGSEWWIYNKPPTINEVLDKKD